MEWGMSTQASYAVVVAALVQAATAQTPPSYDRPAANGFVTVSDGQFLLGGRPHDFAGVNFWQGMNLAVDGPGGDRTRLHAELDQLTQLGVTNVRIMAASEGPNTEPYRMVPALMASPGVYDPNVLDGLDYLLAQIGQRGMRAVMVLNNYWQWSGGMAQYVSWHEGTPIPYPPEHGWSAFMAYAAKFYGYEPCQTWYRSHIEAIVTRTNPYTGLTYRDDPTIFSWELANEPRNYPAEWIDDTAAYIKSLDTNHLVTTGSEGSMGGAFVSTHDGPHIDYATVHIWPQNWGWYDPENPATYPAAETNARSYFQTHLTGATALGKPLVLEEFGLARDFEPLHDIHDPNAPTTFRDLFYDAMFDEVFASASGGGPAAGDNIWAWSGQGRPGDDWTGDPPHEVPGWYSVYDADATTLAVISAHAAEMASISGSFLLTVQVVNEPWGNVELVPEPNDANLPGYPFGTAVTLTAIPITGRAFGRWEIYDPNHPGDANYVVVDSNNPIAIVMSADREVTAVFKCGEGAGVMLLPLIGAVLVAFLHRRLGAVAKRSGCRCGLR